MQEEDLPLAQEEDLVLYKKIFILCKKAIFLFLVQEGDLATKFGRSCDEVATKIGSFLQSFYEDRGPKKTKASGRCHISIGRAQGGIKVALSMSLWMPLKGEPHLAHGSNQMSKPRRCEGSLPPILPSCNL